MRLTMPHWKLYCFGPPRLEKGSVEVRFSQRKDIALFVYLAVNGQAYQRDTLAALLWPENDQQEARGRLRRALYRLRQSAGEELLLITGDTVQVDPALLRDSQAGLWLDTQAFRGLVEGCTSPQPGPKLPTACRATLTQAAALYTADFLAGFTLKDSPQFDEWQFFTGDELRASLARVLVLLASDHRSAGEFEQAIGYARRWLALDALHEPSHRLLMELYSASGQVSAALRQYELCMQILQEQLGVEPEPETIALYEHIRKGGMAGGSKVEKMPPAAPGSLPTSAQPIKPQPANFPTFLTLFVGRESELKDITRLLLDPERRLLTLMGPGGIGKTRLAVQAAIQAADLAADPVTPGGSVKDSKPFQDGIYFVSLIALSEASEIVQATAGALSFAFSSKGGIPPRKQLLDYLCGKDMLLVLDNFEHLLDDISLQWVADLLGASQKLKLLVTSRLWLNLQGEGLYPVGGLSIPDEGSLAELSSPQELTRVYSAINLFTRSAVRAKSSFELSPENLLGVIRVCRLVQGMPLGIELAAAWSEILSPEEIAAEIERSLDFLESDWRDLPERQRSLRAVFETSWRGLSPHERAVLGALTIFHGGFTRQAAQQVCEASLKVLMALNHKSWLQVGQNGRYDLHELLRQYAGEIFRQDETAWLALRDRHSAYYADFLRGQGEAMKGPGERAALEAVALEFQNIRDAWLRLLELGRFPELFDLLYGLVHFLRSGVMLTESKRLLEVTRQAVSAADSAEGRSLVAAIITIQVIWESYVGVPVLDWLSMDIQTAWDLAGGLAQPGPMGAWAALLAQEYTKFVDPELGARRLREVVELLREHGPAWSLAVALAALGAVLKRQDKAEARRCLEEALDLYRKLGSQTGQAETLRELGKIAIEQGAHAEAAAFLEAGRQVAGAAGDILDEMAIQWDLGAAYLYLGEFSQAFATFEAQRLAAKKAGWGSIEIMSLSTYSFEAVRYGDLELAREKRLESLALSRLFQDTNGLAWAHFEMGEVCRVAGDLSAAQTWYAQALNLFQQYGVTIGISFYQRGLGEIALSQGEFEKAQAHFDESYRLARKYSHEWATAYALSGMGRAAAGLEQFETARQRLREALTAARELGNPGLILVSVGGLADLLLREGDTEGAARLSAFVLEYYAAWRETRARAETTLQAALSRLPGHSAADYREPAQGLDLGSMLAGWFS
jgi:predicted ATPase/DNA-binding SARP family transcriptional activator